jgi:hypothetical protein
MTEAEWLECDDPVRLLSFATQQLPFRKVLLYGVACCREQWHLFPNPYSRAAVEWAERYADGLVTRDDEDYSDLDWRSEGAALHYEYVLATARPNRVEAWEAWWDEESTHDLARLSGQIPSPEEVTEEEIDSETARLCNAAYLAQHLMHLDNSSPLDLTLSRYQSFLTVPLLRDIFGNPFRLVELPQPWRSLEWIDHARWMYESRDFSAMPILADALQDAGCEDEHLLEHCRGPGPHVRGCWVMDLLLGKKARL